MILRPSQRVYRPPERFALNAASPQANGLIGWFPFAGQYRGNTRVVNAVLGTEHDPTSGIMAWENNAEYQAYTYWDGKTWYNPALAGSISTHFTVAYCAMLESSADQRVWTTGNQNSNNRQLNCGAVSATTLALHMWGNDLTVTVPNHAGTWIWYAGVFDGSKPSYQQMIYSNGILVGARSNSIGFIGNQFHYLGRANWGGAWKGKILDVRIYNRALSADEVWQLYDPATRWELYQPERRFWAINPTPTILATGIASVEAFGQAELSGGEDVIYAQGIAPGEAVGEPEVKPATEYLTPTGIASQEGLGQPALEILASRATQVLVEYDRSVDHQLRATQVLVEYDWLEPGPENNVPAAMMHYQRIRRAG